jgi:peptide/nickel transport system permease protein
MTTTVPASVVPWRAPFTQWVTRIRRSRTLRRYLGNRLAIVGTLFVLALVVVAVLAPVLAPHSPSFQVITNRLASPGADHWLGTDTLGRDVWSRLIYGTRVSLVAGAEAVGVALLLGVPLGLVSGLIGGAIDTAVNVVFDAIMSVPGIVFALAVISALGPGLTNAMLAIGIIASPRFYRLARASASELKHETFIEASTAMGCSKRRVISVHVLPNAVPPLAVQASFVLGTSILAEASLSFLGFGVRPPTASWGGMLADAATRLDKSFLIYGPGIALTLTILAFSAIGDGWRDALGLDKREVDNDAP